MFMKLPRVTLAVVVGLTLASCASTNMTTPPPIEPPGIGRSDIVQTGDEPPFSPHEAKCLRQVFEVIGQRQVAFVGDVQNDASGAGGPLQLSYRRDLKGFLTSLGLRPVEGNPKAVDLIITGSLVEFARVVHIDERSEDFGILTRALDLQPSRAAVLREGTVTARIVIDAPYERASGELVYAGYATGTATVRYYSRQREGRITGTVVAISAGVTTKRSAIVDSQTASAYAMKLASISALIKYLDTKGVQRLAARGRHCLAG